MEKQLKNGLLNGTLFAGEDAVDDDRYNGDNDEELRRGVMFSLDERDDITFRSGIGGYMSLKDGHIVSENGTDVYYPYYNETVCEVGNPHVQDTTVEKVADDISLRYTAVNDEVYIHSQSEVTAYTHNYMIINGEVYAIVDSLMHSNHKDYQKDSFLELSGLGGVRVKNMRTEQVRAVEGSKVRDLLENDENNGALKVNNPDMDRYNPARSFAESLD